MTLLRWPSIKLLSQAKWALITLSSVLSILWSVYCTICVSDNRGWSSFILNFEAIRRQALAHNCTWVLVTSWSSKNLSIKVTARRKTSSGDLESLTTSWSHWAATSRVLMSEVILGDVNDVEIGLQLCLETSRREFWRVSKRFSRFSRLTNWSLMGDCISTAHLKLQNTVC